MALIKEIAVYAIFGAGIGFAVFGFLVTILGLLGYCTCNFGME